MCASTLGLLILSVVAAILVPAFKASGQVAARVEMEQQISVVLLRITRELQQTQSDSLAYFEGTQGACLSLHRVEGVTLGDPPVPVYSRQLIFYYLSQSRGTLVRSAWPSDPAHPFPIDSLLLPPDGSQAVQPVDSSLRKVVKAAPPGQQLASSVQTFQVTSPAADLSSPLSVTLQLAKVLPGKAQPTTLRLTQVVSIRNRE